MVCDVGDADAERLEAAAGAAARGAGYRHGPDAWPPPHRPQALRPGERDAVKDRAAGAAAEANRLKERGNLYKADGKLQEAAECYRRALEVDPDYGPALYNLGDRKSVV